MRKITKLTALLLTVLMLFALVGCSDEKASEPTYTEPQYEDVTAPQQSAELPNEAAKWTVLMYLCGTDLESNFGSATQNIAEMVVDIPSDDVNVILQTGGTAQWQNDVVDPSAIQRWRVVEYDLELVDEQPLASMGDAQTLADFLVWGTENYPAEKTMVLFWDHGGGSAAGVAYDELYENDFLSLSELKAGLEAPGISYELVGFDTCLMATMELANILSPMANYMVASEELEPGSGWDYSAWLTQLYESPDTGGAALGRVICDSYYEKCALSGNEAMATLSLIDLKKLPALMESFEAMVGEMSGITSDITTYRDFVQGAMRAENYGGNNDNEGYTNMVDLGDLAMNTVSVLPQTADNVLTALFDAVVYSVKGESRSEANGLSVFFPLAFDDDMLTSYALKAMPSAGYVRFIEGISGWTAPSDIQAPQLESAVSKDEYTLEYETYLDDESMFNLSVTGGLETVASVAFDLYYMDYEYNEYMLLGRDNDITADWDSGLFTDNFRGVWPIINGFYCSLTLLEENENYNLYSIPVMLNGEKTSLRAAYVFDENGGGAFEVYGAWNGIDGETGMSSRNIVKLKDGDEVTLLFDCYNWDTGETQTYQIGSFTVDGPVLMVESLLYNGDYAYSFTITDIFGETYTTDSVIMECIDGEISVYETE